MRFFTLSMEVSLEISQSAKMTFLLSRPDSNRRNYRI